MNPAKEPDVSNKNASASEDLQGLFVSARRLIDDLNTRHNQNILASNTSSNNNIRNAAFLRLENIVEKFEREQRRILQLENSSASDSPSTLTPNPSHPPSDADTRVNSLNELFESFGTALDHYVQSSPLDDRSEIDEHTALLRASCLPAPLRVKARERISTASSYETCSVSDLLEHDNYFNPLKDSSPKALQLKSLLTVTEAEPVRVQSWLSSCSVPVKLSLGRNSYQALIDYDAGQNLIPLGAIKVYIAAHIHHAQTLGLMAPKRKAAKAAHGSPAKMRKYESMDLVFSEKSVLIDANLHNYFLNPEAWKCLDEDERQTILDLLPKDVPLNADGAPSEEFLRYDLNWRRGLRQFQEDLEQGRYDPEWLAEAEEAMQERQAGLFDNWKDQEFEEYWGQKAIPDQDLSTESDEEQKPKKAAKGKRQSKKSQGIAPEPPVEENKIGKEQRSRRDSKTKQHLKSEDDAATSDISDTDLSIKVDKPKSISKIGKNTKGNAIAPVDPAPAKRGLLSNSSLAGLLSNGLLRIDDVLKYDRAFGNMTSGCLVHATAKVLEVEDSKMQVEIVLDTPNEDDAKPAPLGKSAETVGGPSKALGPMPTVTTNSRDLSPSHQTRTSSPELSGADAISKARSGLRPIPSKRPSMQSPTPTESSSVETSDKIESSESSRIRSPSRTPASTPPKASDAEAQAQRKSLRSRKSMPSGAPPPIPKLEDNPDLGSDLAPSVHWISGVQELEDIILGLCGRTFTARPRTLAWQLVTRCRGNEAPKTLAQLRDGLRDDDSNYC